MHKKQVGVNVVLVGPLRLTVVLNGVLADIREDLLTEARKIKGCTSVEVEQHSGVVGLQFERLRTIEAGRVRREVKEAVIKYMGEVTFHERLNGEREPKGPRRLQTYMPNRR